MKWYEIFKISTQQSVSNLWNIPQWTYNYSCLLAKWSLYIIIYWNVSTNDAKKNESRFTPLWFKHWKLKIVTRCTCLKSKSRQRFNRPICKEKQKMKMLHYLTHTAFSRGVDVIFTRVLLTENALSPLPYRYFLWKSLRGFFLFSTLAGVRISLPP